MAKLKVTRGSAEHLRQVSADTEAQLRELHPNYDQMSSKERGDALSNLLFGDKYKNAPAAAAPAATKKGKLTAEEIAAYTLLGEAQGEGPEGMAAVMHVIKNRAESGQYPSNIGAVALQKSPKGYQFTTWSPKHGNSPTKKYSKNSKEFKQAMAIVEAVMSGDIPDPTGAALNYFANQGANKIVEPGWFKKAASDGKVQIGNHVFAARSRANTVDPADLSAKVQAAINKPQAPTPMSGRPAKLVAPPKPAFGDIDINNQLPMARPQQQSITGGKSGADNRTFSQPQPQPAQALKTNTVKLVQIDAATGAVVMQGGQPVPVAAQPKPQPTHTGESVASRVVQPTAAQAQAKPSVQSPGGAGLNSGPYKRPTTSGSQPSRTVVVGADGVARLVQAPKAAAIPPGVRPAAVDALFQKMPKPDAVVHRPAQPPSQGSYMNQTDGSGGPPKLGSKLVVAQQPVAAKPSMQAPGGQGSVQKPSTRTVAVQKIIRTANPEYDLTDAEKAAVISANANLNEQRQEQALLRALEQKRKTQPQFIEKSITVQREQQVQQRHQQQVTQYQTQLQQYQAQQAAQAAAGGGGGVYQPPTTTIATGKTVPVGLSYSKQTNGNVYQYTVQADGSIKNDTTGKITATSKGSTTQWAKDAGYF